MKFEVENRFTRSVQFTAEITCGDRDRSSRLGLAVQWAIENGANLHGADLGGANLYGANLYGANFGDANLGDANLGDANLYGANFGDANLGYANLHGADLGGADLGGANLYSANLGDANLYGANLDGANLDGANFGGANLYRANFGDQWIIQGPVRADGYAFFLQKLTGDTEPMINAGCRYLTVAAARDHWTKTRGGTPLGDETFAILDFLERTAAIRRGGA
jgi:uncharacterized protein YjbI with pentapeptide repeats